MSSQTSDLIDRFTSFLVESPSSFHAADAVAAQLSSAGFHLLDETMPWSSKIVAGARLCVVRDGAVIAWVMPENVSPTTPVHIVGSHTDSPGFAVKPHPSFSAHGFAQVGVEVYGGPILDTWFDRELEFAGRLVDAHGQQVLVRSGAVARIPQLAIHLDRAANDTRTIDRQLHLQPIAGVGEFDLIEHLATSVGLDRDDVQGFELITVDAQTPARFGVNHDLFASGRLDNLTSVFASLEALQTVSTRGHSGEQINMLAAFDHEEVGSQSRTGASGPFLEDVLERIFAALGSSRDERAQAFANSWCVSADAAHSIHPNHASKHDPNVQPRLGAGPVLKLNANQRYTTDAHGSAFWRNRAQRAGVAVQEFVSNNQVPAGSTIGPLTATRLGIRTLDVGIPLLSMHSARELCHVDDLAAFQTTLEAVYE
jgi:aspartyl aminopeptidase